MVHRYAKDARSESLLYPVKSARMAAMQPTKTCATMGVLVRLDTCANMGGSIHSRAPTMIKRALINRATSRVVVIVTALPIAKMYCIHCMPTESNANTNAW